MSPGPGPRPPERRETCGSCFAEFTPDRCPHGCPRCFVGAMASRVLSGRRRPDPPAEAAPLPYAEPEPVPVGVAAGEINGFEQYDDDDGKPLPF